MSAVTAHHDDHAHGHEMPYEVQLKSNRLGLWLFCFSELFLFIALLSARFVLWGNHRPELSQELGLITTSVLLVSSYFVYRGESAMGHGDRRTFLSSYLIAALLGAVFFVGVVVMEWNIFGLEANVAGIEVFGHLKPSDGVEAGIFFAMTGMHALHVLSGIIFLLIVWNNGRRGHFSAEKHWGVEACAIYWHYVDVIWVFFYPALYLIGTPFHG
ncbi:MAG: cytochrome c oxidase subunit 3 [Chloroflexota bacterium]